VCVCVCVCMCVCVRVRVCVCVSVALGIQHAMGMRGFVICGLFDRTIFFALSHKRKDCRKRKLLNIKCVF